MSTTRFLALLAVLTLALGAFAAPAIAQSPDDERRGRGPDERGPGDRSPGRPDGAPDDRRPDGRPDGRPDNRGPPDDRPAPREAPMARAEAFRQRCAEENATADNGTDACDRARRAHEPPMKARREAHALMGAVAAVERKIGQLEAFEVRIEQQMGNQTEENRTAAAQRLERIDDLQERLVARLSLLHERIDALHAKWEAVRDHVAERRQRGDYDAPDCDARLERHSERADAWKQRVLAEADRMRDRRLAEENLTQEEQERIEAGYNRTVERIEAAYAERMEKAEAFHARCTAAEREAQAEEDEVGSGEETGGADDGSGDATPDADDDGEATTGTSTPAAA